MFLSSPNLVIWPKNHSLEVYLDKKDNNHFVFDFDLWQPLSSQDISSLQNFFKSQKKSKTYLVIPNDIIVTKSFLYESNIESINKEEIMAMIGVSVDFKIDPDNLTYKLEQNNNKTIIRATIVDNPKLDILSQNLSKIGIKITDYQSQSNLITNVISQFYQEDYCLIYPVDPPQYLFLLAQNTKIFLTDIIKATSLDINKKVNYSELYFGKIAQKLFLPTDFTDDLKINSQISPNPFDESQISTKLGKSSNLPIPVLSFFDKNLYSQLAKNPDIIKLPSLESYQPKPEKNMEETRTKTKNPILIFVVFIASLILVSAGLWFLINKPKSDVVSPSSDQNQTEDITPMVIEDQPTTTPTPVVSIDKDLKIRVLNATEINGQAALVKTDLTTLGFTDLSTGNSSEELTSNTIRYKASLATVGLEAYFKTNLTNFSQADFEDTLKETDTYDVVILIGEKLNTSSSPSATPTSSIEESD